MSAPASAIAVASSSLNTYGVPHAGLLQVLPEHAVDEPDRREVLHSGEAHRLELAQEHVRQVERVGPVDAREHRRVPDDREHLVGHLHDDIVGVAVRQQTGQRAPTGHPVAAGVVDHDQVDAAGLLPLGRQPGAGAAADDRLPARRHVVEVGDQLSSAADHQPTTGSR
jgi:hypothetical protein